MRLWQKLVLMNIMAVGGCLILLNLIPGPLPMSVYFVTALLAFALGNTIMFLGPHLSRGPAEKPERLQLLITFALLIFAGFLAWMSYRR